MKLFRISTVPISLNILLKGQLRFLSHYYEVTAISSAGKDLDEVAEREGVKVHPIEIQRRISPLKDLVSLYKLYRYFKKEKPDIIHSHTPKAGLLSMMAGKFARIPVRIHTFTGLIFPYKTGFSKNLLIFTDKILCMCATHIFPEGEGVKKDLISYKITEKPLKIIGNGNINGIDLEYFNPNQITEFQKTKLKEELKLSEDDFVFIFVGRLVKDKGLNELVSAFKEFLLHQNSSNRPSKLLLVGPLEQDLDPIDEETLSEIKANPNIISVGFQEDVRPYFSISNALVFPSYREGFPNVVLQAGAMGLPSIVTDISGCNEIISHRENGLIIKPKNSQDLREKMNLLHDDTILFNALKLNSRKRIEEKYSQDLLWQSLLSEYREIQKKCLSK